MGALPSTACVPCYAAADSQDYQTRGVNRTQQIAPTDKTVPSYISSTNFPYFTMTEHKKSTIRKHFSATLKAQRPDIFHKTMLMCIQSSPKLNEIIACQMYCYRDLTKWPKLNKLSQAQFDFFERLIEQYHLDSMAVSEAAYQMGIVHYRYAEYGLKPHFLDLWRQHLETLIQKLKFDNPEEQDEFCEAFRELMRFVAETMHLAYTRSHQQSGDMKTTEKSEPEIIK